MKLGFFSGKKKQARGISPEPVEVTEAAEAVEAAESALSMDWDNVYVEIDDDANVPVINKTMGSKFYKSPTEPQNHVISLSNSQNRSPLLPSSESAIDDPAAKEDEASTSSVTTGSVTEKAHTINRTSGSFWTQQNQNPPSPRVDDSRNELETIRDEENQGPTVTQTSSNMDSGIYTGSGTYTGSASGTETGSNTFRGSCTYTGNGTYIGSGTTDMGSGMYMDSGTYMDSGIYMDSGTHMDSGNCTVATMRKEDPTINVEDMPDRHILLKPENTFDQHTITRDGKYLSNNQFANAQLMSWKHAAEEGPALIQIMAVAMSIGAMVATIYPLVAFSGFWSMPLLICAFHTIMLCCLIIAFDMRTCGARNPMSLRGRIRNFLVGNLTVLRTVWGRGLLYILTGSMNLTISYYPYTFYTGCMLMALGFLTVLMGAHASFHLERLRLSLTDPSYLWSKFVEADTSADNIINLSDFSNLIWSLGLELSDDYTYRAFSQLDKDSDDRVTFQEFKKWWIAGRASQDGDGGTIMAMNEIKVSTVQPAERVPSPQVLDENSKT